MAEVRSFSAIRYDFSGLKGDISTRLAPPYDILDQSDKDRLLSGSDRNIVKIDLPHVPPGFEGPPERYAEAASTLKQWLADGTLVRETKPAIYIYHQSFTHGGRAYVRKKFFASVRLRPFTDRVILPHEHTFGGPKADRLALMKSTQCSLSPVFGLYQDQEGTIAAILAGAVNRTPDAVGQLDGVENRIWIASDPMLVQAVSRGMQEKLIYIADGHHRYGTALNYRDWILANHGDVPMSHPARFALFVLADMDDPGCLVLPTHRIFTDVSFDVLLKAWEPGCRVCSEAEADITVLDGKSQRRQPLKFSDRDVLAKLEPSRSEPWRKLDLAYMHRYLMDELLTSRTLGGKAPSLSYAKSDEQAVKMAKDGPAVAVFVRPTQMSELRAVCDADDLMPQKSTFFYPKLATGVAMMPLQ